jgi:hypothetical protein
MATQCKSLARSTDSVIVKSRRPNWGIGVPSTNGLHPRVPAFTILDDEYLPVSGITSSPARRSDVCTGDPYATIYYPGVQYRRDPSGAHNVRLLRRTTNENGPITIIEKRLAKSSMCVVALAVRCS